MRRKVEVVRAPASDNEDGSGYKIDDFYYLSRTTLVKDEKHYDKFDRAFASYFKGVETVADFTQDIPLEWLRKNLELELSPEEKAKIEKMGWDELMETLKKRFEEQKERHEGGNKKVYDPRAWGKAAEAGMAARVVEACQNLRSAGTTLGA